MADCAAQNALIERLAGELGAEAAAALVARWKEAARKPDLVATVSALLDELVQVSPKASRAALQAISELDRRTGLVDGISWLDLGITLAQSSGATALKYFRDSPHVLGLIEQAEARTMVLAIGLELAERDANVAWEYLKTAPQVFSSVPPDEVRLWLEIGLDLAAVDAVVGLEYVRQIPHVAAVLPIGEVRGWLSFGMRLVVPNALGKPDYLGAIEFMRTSPTLLQEIEHHAVRSKVLSLGISLAGQSPEAGATWLGEAPGILRALATVERQIKALQYGALLAEKDAEAALRYFRRCPDIMGLIGDGPQALSRFETWFKAGMDVLAYSGEGARAFFAVESQKALASVEQAMSGVPLRRIARRVKLFVQGLCGTDVAVVALPDSVSVPAPRATVSADGRTISLPTVLRRYATADENERLYLVMAAHEAGHLEFGTYRLKLESLADMVDVVRRRYGRSQQAMPETLAAVFRLYPDPSLVRDVWTVLEDARIEFLLQAEYPGLRRDLARLAAEAVTPRDLAQGLTVKELMVDCLLRLSTGESAESAVPHAVKEEVSILWALCRPLFSTTATAADAVRATHDLYIKMEELLASGAGSNEAERTSEEWAEVRGTSGTSDPTSGMYRPMTNWIYRGQMNPEFITRDREPGHSQEEEEKEPDWRAGEKGGARSQTGAGQGARSGEEDSQHSDILAGGRSLPSAVEELLALDVEPLPTVGSMAHDERAKYYPEWDYAIQDYRVNWCRVVEQPAEAGSDEGVDAILTMHRTMIKSLRRFFEGLRPPAFRRIGGQAEGEEPDIDAVVRRAAELQAGQEGTERLYIRREKRERDVAVAFLVDISGSTGRRLDSGRRAIDVEKESLVLLCEALEAVGDQYALYAYSGQGRAAVEFLTIKDFDDRLGAVAAHRLGGLVPRQQNRDGAAIRHASAKLTAREAKHRLLILLSDGRPLDGEYKDEYALEDTRAALREAGRKGIAPFCVTIDQDADAYLRRMYGDVQFAVIDRVESLPLRLPKIYQRLTA